MFNRGIHGENYITHDAVHNCTNQVSQTAKLSSLAPATLMNHTLQKLKYVNTHIFQLT